MLIFHDLSSVKNETGESTNGETQVTSKPIIQSASSKKMDPSSHFNEKQHRCYKCKIKLKSLFSLRQHLNRVICRNILNTEEYTSIFYDKSKFQSYFGYNNPYQCEYCKKLYFYKHQLTQHVNEFHLDLLTQNTYYKCDFCGRVFLRKHKLVTHIEQYHLTQKMNQRSPWLKNLTSDIDTHLKCKHHKDKAVDLSKVDNHVKICPGRNRYGCNNCVKRFDNLYDLRKHYFEKHLSTYIKSCKKCKT